MKTRQRNRLFWVIGVVTLGLGLVGYLIPGKTSENPLRIYYSTAGGSVLFPHKRHAQMQGLKCRDCHHELLRTDEISSCDQCHKDEQYSSGDFEHNELVEIHSPNCSVCHGRADVEPASCRKCHSQNGEYQPVSCKRCHQEEEYDPKDFTHADLMKIEGHWCTECHRTRRVMDAFHLQCNRCHQDLEESTYVKDLEGQGEALSCKVCHLKAGH